MKGLASSSDDEEKVKRTAGVRLRRNRSFADREARPHHYTSRRISLALLAVAAGSALIALYQSRSTKDGPALASRSLASLSEDERTAWSEVVDRCEDLHTPPGVPESFWQRRENDRFAAVRARALSLGLRDSLTLPTPPSRAPPPL